MKMYQLNRYLKLIIRDITPYNNKKLTFTDSDFMTAVKWSDSSQKMMILGMHFEFNFNI